MRYWDPSAIMPLIAQEPSSNSARAIHERDRQMFVWWGAEIECVSAISRIERRGVTAEDISRYLDRLDLLAVGWTEVDPSDAVRRNARRLLRTHELRAGDALQLAAALQASEGFTSMLDFVCQDARLNEAARREGFFVIDPQAV